MHELSITRSLLDLALRHADQAGARRVTDLYIVIGELASIVDDSVQFYWDIVTADTLAAGSQLHFRRILAEFVCGACGKTFSADKSRGWTCPACGAQQTRLMPGADVFYLESIGISDEDPDPRAEE